MAFTEDLVSIVTPVYNAEEYLEETIESVLAQGYSHWEWYLVNDCSTDQSKEVAAPYLEQDPRLHWIDLKENSGAAVARNAGIEAGKGQYIAFIDSDDVWKPEKLQRQLHFMKENKVYFSYTNFSMMAEDGKITKARADLPLSLDYEGLLRNTAISCTSVIIDRNQVGDFRMPLLRKGQDTATWLMLLRTREDLKAYCFDEPMHAYRQHPGSISSNKLKALKRTWHIYRHVEKLPLTKASYVFVSYVWHAIQRRL